MKKFQNIAEFEQLPDDEKIDFYFIENLLDKLCIKKLPRVLTRFVLIRKLQIKKWIKEVSKITPNPIKLYITQEEIIPYMKEEGVISFCKKDIYRVDKIFMILAHETAHFILMQDKNYESIKKVDKEYTQMLGHKEKMNSPIEYCANLITLMILQRCKFVEKKPKMKEKIGKCMKKLSNQLTK